MNHLILFGIIVVYLAIIAFLSYRGYKQTRNSSDYLVAGRSIHPFVMAMSYGAAFISTSAIVGFGGVAAMFGMGLLWLPFMNIAIGVLVAFLFFGRRTRRIGHRLNARTFPEFIGERFGDGKLKILCGVIIFLFMPLYSAVVLIGGARFLQQTLEIPYQYALYSFAIFIAVYVTIGGLKGVMYIDAMMGSIMFLGMIFLLVMTYISLGGIGEAHSALSAMEPLVPEKLKAVGHAGWTRMPLFNSEWWWTLVSSLMLGVGIGALAQPQLAVRFMTVRSGKQLNQAILVGSIFILVTAGGAYAVGALSNVWFFRHPDFGVIAQEAAGGNPDLIIPLYINHAMPKWFIYLFTITLLSAAMSTLSSLYHVTGTSAGHDIYGNLCPQHRENVLVTRGAVLIGIVVSVLLGLALPDGIVARGTAIFFGVCAAAFLPTYCASIYWKRATRAGVWSSIITGIVISLFGLLFLHRSESAPLGICQALFGKTELLSEFPWPFVDTIVYALPISFAVLIAVSLFTRPPHETLLNTCFDGLDQVNPPDNQE